MKNTKRIIALILVFVISLCSVSCGKVEEKEYYDAYFTAMDTQITIRLARDSGVKDGKDTIYFEDAYLSEIATECGAIIARVEGIFSKNDENSLTYEINGEADRYLNLSDEFVSLLNRSFEISEKTGGAFDVTLGSITSLWNFTAEAPEVPSDEAIAESLSHAGRDKYTVSESDITKNDKLSKLDFGAIAKGYALGLVTEYLEQSEVLYGLVSFGGSVSVFGSKGEDVKFKVGITDPSDTSKVVGYVYVDGGYVTVSSDYERYFEKDGVRYHHIIDGKTGRPAETDISSVSVICGDAALGDALSTALFVMGSEGAMEFYKSAACAFEAVITLKDGTTVVTEGLSENQIFEAYVEPETEE